MQGVDVAVLGNRQLRGRDRLRGHLTTEDAGETRSFRLPAPIEADLQGFEVQEGHELVQ
ncbi:hypothetical protein GCM10008944_31060 [Cytobacillus oceanisediminis]